MILPILKTTGRYPLLPKLKLHMYGNFEKTAMHSSRMRTARFSGCLGGGGCLPRGCVCLGGCLPRGVCPGMYTSWTQRQTPQLHARIHTPPVNRITDRCKNITFPRIRLRAVKIGIFVDVQKGTSFLSSTEPKPSQKISQIRGVHGMKLFHDFNRPDYLSAS